MIKQYLFKADEKMLDDLKMLAEKNYRSLNKEIEYALSLYIEQNK